jgi:hypothetical protein
MRSISWQPMGSKCTSCKCTGPDHYPHARADDEGCQANPSLWLHFAPASSGELIATPRFAPRDQSSGVGRPHEGKFFGGRAREILKIVTAAEQPQHGIDVVSGVIHDRRTNGYLTLHLGPALSADATILRGSMIDTWRNRLCQHLCDAAANLLLNSVVTITNRRLERRQGKPVSNNPGFCMGAVPNQQE